jgi:hypothetical protein
VLVAFWARLGPNAIPLGVFLSALAQAAITIFFTLRAARLMRLPPPRPRLRHLRRLLPAASALEHLRAGLAGALPATANLLITALVVLGSLRDRSALLVLHALVPLFSVAGGWAQVLYVDLHWLLRPWRAAMLRRFERALDLAAPIVALLLAPLVAPLAWLIVRRTALSWTAAILALLAAQALIAVIELRLFVRGRFGALALAAVVQIAGILVATFALSRMVPVRGSEEALICAAVDLLVVLLLRRELRRVPYAVLDARRIDSSGAPVAEASHLLAWVTELSAKVAPVQAGVLVVRRMGSFRLRSVVARLEGLLGVRGAVGVDRARRLFFWAPAGRELPPAGLLASGGGMARELHLLHARHGAEALGKLAGSGLIGPIPGARQTGAPPPELPRSSRPLAEQIADRCPEALHVDFERGTCPAAVRALAPWMRKQIFAAAEGAARASWNGRNRTPFKVVCESPGGVLLGAFLVPRSVPVEVLAMIRQSRDASDLSRSAGWALSRAR